MPLPLFSRMSSKSKYHDCWICSERFDKNADLKQHAILSHQVCRVICPWCNEEERCFNRMSDLTKHTKRRHHDLTKNPLDAHFFTKKNGFWLSLKPQHYKRIAKPTDWESLVSMRARIAVLKWVFVGNAKKSSKTREEWERGWKEVLPICGPSSQPSPSIATQRKRKYSPTRSQITPASNNVCQVSHSSEGKTTLLKAEEVNGVEWYKVEFVHWLSQSRQPMDSLLRRMGTTKRTDTVGAPSEF